MPQRTRNRPENEGTPQAAGPSAPRTDWTAANAAAAVGDQAIDNVLGWDVDEYQASTPQEGGQ